jgi:hypothetical protein
MPWHPPETGSQKLTSRQPRTASLATVRGLPKLTINDAADASTMPRPPGALGHDEVVDDE